MNAAKNKTQLKSTTQKVGGGDDLKPEWKKNLFFYVNNNKVSSV
jgi:hypothetical protein